MSRCPYCGGKIENRPEYAKMSFKRRSVFQFILESGQKGVDYIDLKERFFADHADGTVRTTVHYINEAIKPMRIECHGSRFRVIPK